MVVLRVLHVHLDGLAEDVARHLLVNRREVLSGAHDERLFEQPTRFEIGNESGDCLVALQRELAVIQDVACELLNTISGRVMKRVLPAECMFHLGLPEIADRPFDLMEPFVMCSFLADGNLLTVAAQV